MKPRLLIATDVTNINGLTEKLANAFDVTYLPSCTNEDLHKVPSDIEAIFTNPNNSKIYFGEETLRNFKSIKYLVTASTGTIHIDKAYCARSNIRVISITKSIDVLEKITSTAELAFLLTLSAIRHYDLSRKSVDELKWDYSPFIGRQMNSLTVGVLGFGRLGKMYASYCRAFGSEVLVCDPYQLDSVVAAGYTHVELAALFGQADLVSIHIHAEEQNIGLINENLLSEVSKQFVLINTSRGEVVNEAAILSKAHDDPDFRYFSDVITGEHLGLTNADLRQSSLYGKQIFLTPHCGGMTSDARFIAYHHAADLFLESYV